MVFLTPSLGQGWLIIPDVLQLNRFQLDDTASVIQILPLVIRKAMLAALKGNLTKTSSHWTGYSEIGGLSWRHAAIDNKRPCAILMNAPVRRSRSCLIPDR